MKTVKQLNLRMYITGLLPLFIFAHFGHHVVGAMLRPLMPMIRSDLGISYAQVGFIMSAFSMTNGFSQLPAGWLVDRFGPRAMVLLAISGVAVVGILIGFSDSYAVLIGLLVVAAIVGGGYHPAASATISLSVPAEYRGRALGFHFVGGSSTFWIVPLMAAPIAVAWGWRGSFLTLSIPTIVLGLLLYVLMGRREQAQPIETHEVESESTKKSAGIPWRKLVPLILLSVTGGTMIMSVSSYLSLYAVDSLGVSEATAAMLMSISPAVGLVAAPTGGYLSDRFGSIKVLVVISFLVIPLIYLLGMASSVATLAVLMLAIGVVNTTRMPTSESYIAGNTPPRRRATILGLYFFAGTEVAGLLTPVVGVLIDRFGFASTFSIVSGSTAVLMVICSLILWKNRQ